jgi:hypothetical protein
VSSARGDGGALKDSGLGSPLRHLTIFNARVATPKSFPTRQLVGRRGPRSEPLLVLYRHENQKCATNTKRVWPIGMVAPESASTHCRQIHILLYIIFFGSSTEFLALALPRVLIPGGIQRISWGAPGLGGGGFFFFVWFVSAHPPPPPPPGGGDPFYPSHYSD